MAGGLWTQLVDAGGETRIFGWLAAQIALGQRGAVAQVRFAAWGVGR